MGFMLLSTLTVALMGGIVRHVSVELEVFMIAFFRILFGFLVFTPLFVRHGFVPLKTKRLGLHAFRGFLNSFAILLTFLAFSMVPLAKVMALKFTGPLFATILALVILGEVIRARRITALIIGFAGALVIVRPGVEVVDIGSLIILGAAFFWGLITIVVKMLTRTESNVAIAVYTTIFTMPITLAIAIPYWQTPTPEQFLWLFALGGLGSISHWCRAQAARDADITAIMPVDFSVLIWAALIGYFAFGEIPGLWIWIGALIIFSATTYIAYRERQIRNQRKS